MTDANQLAGVAQSHLAVLNNPSATPSQISQANSGLDAFKNTLTPATALQLANVLLAPLFPVPTTSPSLSSIHFAFHVIDAHLLQSAQPWTSFPDDIRSSVRSMATTIINQLRDAHPQLLRQKAVALLVALALREWPQRWPDFLDHLLQPSTPALIACHVLQDLSDQIHVFSDRIQNTRRQELRQAMALSLPQTLAYVTRVVDTAVSQSVQSTTELVLECLHSFVQWADLRALFSASVPSACIALLKRIETRDAALRVLETLVTRQFTSVRPPNSDEDKTGKTENAAAAAAAATALALNPEIVLRESLFPALLQFVAEQSHAMLSLIPFSLIEPAGIFPQLKAWFETSTSIDSIDEEEYSFFVQFMSVMSLLGISHFVSTFLYSKRSNMFELSEADATCAAAFIDLITVCAASPSAAIQLSVLPFLNTLSSALAKHPAGSVEIANDKLVRFIATAVLQCTSVVQVRPTGGANSNPIYDRFRELDDLDDVQAVSAGTIPQRFAAASSVASRVVPDIAVQVAIERFKRILELKPTSTSANAVRSTEAFSVTFRQRGFILSDGTQHGWTFGSFSLDCVSEWRACVEASCHFVDAVSVGVLNQNFQSQAIASTQLYLTENMRAIFDVVQPNTEEILIPVKPHLLRVLHPLYSIDEDRLGKCIKTLLEMAISCDRMPQGQSSKGFRGKIFSALSAMLRKLGNSNVKGIGRFWEPLCSYTSTALAGQELTSMHKINLMEAALATVMVLNNVSIQSDGVERVLNPLLEFLSSEQVSAVLRTPIDLLNFLQKGDPAHVEKVCQAFLMLEAAMHQLVRPISKLNAPIPFPTSLSRAVAPKAVEISCLLINSLHRIYASTSAEIGRTDEDMINIIQPTCREISYVLNIDAAENIPKGIGELVEHGGAAGKNNAVVVPDETGVKPSQGEMRSAQILKANGVQPPDERQSRLRERLRDLRRSGYEIMRAAIFSGAAESVVHVRAIVQAAFTTTGQNSMEPLHALSLLTRVAAPLLSFSVCETGGTYLQTAGELGLCVFLEYLRDLTLGAQRGTQFFSDTRVQDLTREGSRHLITRAAAESISGMLPRIEPATQAEKDKNKGESTNEKEKQKPHFLPRPLRTPNTLNSVISLWAVLCSGINDQGAARAALASLSHGVDLASRNAADFMLYAPLCDAALKIAVVLRGGSAPTDEGAGQTAISALVSIIRKWPQEFGMRVVQMTGAQQEQKDEVTKWVGECINAITTDVVQSAARAKKHRIFVRTLVERLAQMEGIDTSSQSTVHALPEKLSAIIHANKLRNKKLRSGLRRADQDEIELTDNALDSLFGEGDPL